MKALSLRHGTTVLGVVESLLGLVVGLVVAFRGYALARALAALAGFLVGFTLGLVLGLVAGPLGALIVAVILGVVFALLFALAFRLVGAALGALAAVELALALSWPTWVVVLAGAAGLLVGLVANRLVVVLATAWVGSTLATKSGIELLYDAGVRTFPNETMVLFWTTLAVAVLGAIAQWKTLRHEG